MAGVLGLKDVSEKDAGKGKKLKTGNKRSYNMPKECVERMIKEKGMSPKDAHKACYPKDKKGSKLGQAVKSVQASIGGMKARRAIKKYEKKSGSKLPSY